MLGSLTRGSLRWDGVVWGATRYDVTQGVSRLTGPEGWTKGETLFQMWMALFLLGLIGLVIVGMGVLVDAWEGVAMNLYVPMVLTGIVLAGLMKAAMLHPQREDYHLTVRVSMEEATHMLTALMRAEDVNWVTHTTAWMKDGIRRFSQRTSFKHEGIEYVIRMRSRGGSPWTRVTVEGYDEDMEAFLERLGRAFGP